MATAVNLNEIIRAIHNAALEAQKLTEEQHQQQLRRYFKDDGTPVCQVVKVPDDRPETAPGSWRESMIPLYQLVPPTAMRVTELSVEFDAYVVGLDDKDPLPRPGMRILIGMPTEPDAKPVKVKVALESSLPETSVKDVQVSVESLREDGVVPASEEKQESSPAKT